MTHRPLHDWHRRHPTANAIAQELLAQPALLALRPRRLAPDIQAKYRVGFSTAAKAVAIARKAVQ